MEALAAVLIGMVIGYFGCKFLMWLLGDILGFIVFCITVAAVWQSTPFPL